MSDLISRQAAIDVICSACGLCDYHNVARKCDVMDKIKALPSTQQWIPCSEKLPKEKEDVLLQYKNNMIVGFWEMVLGEISWWANSGDGYYTDTDIPIAWMSLPPTYKGEQK